eukprot:6180665-Pleurochrysis_carterae.AAC.2
MQDGGSSPKSVVGPKKRTAQTTSPNKEQAVAALSRSLLGLSERRSTQELHGERPGHTRQRYKNLTSNGCVKSNGDGLAMVSHRRGSGCEVVL